MIMQIFHAEKVRDDCQTFCVNILKAIPLPYDAKAVQTRNQRVIDQRSNGRK